MKELRINSFIQSCEIKRLSSEIRELEGKMQKNNRRNNADARDKAGNHKREMKHWKKACEFLRFGYKSLVPL